MKKHTIVLILSMLFCFNACNKTGADVFIRVNNNTPENFKKVLVNNKSFENVDASGITSYQPFENTLNVPVATLITHNNDTLYAGLVYYDLLEHLASGRYTLKVYKDNTTLSGYNCVYIKD